MIIASRIGDGRVVFMAAPGRWSDAIADGALVDAADEAERLLAAAKDDEAASRVIDPYLIDVAVEDDARLPTSYREAIRAFGPSIRSEFREGK